MSDFNSFLAHHGVLGMKWGRRTSRGGYVAKGGTKEHPEHTDSSKVAELKRQSKTSGIKSLSNNDLQTVITRLNLEKQFKQLDPKQVSSGEKAAKGLLKGSGQVLGQVAKQVAAQQLADLAKKGIKAATTK